MAHTITLSLDQQDELDMLFSCLTAVSDLMIPCNCLTNVDRTDLSTLLGHLVEANKKGEDTAPPDSCLTAVLDLLNPHYDLCNVSKDGLSCLLGYLCDRLKTVTFGGV